MISPRAVLSGLACLACSMACAGSPFHGGYAMPDQPLPGTKTLARFIPGHCEDASHGEQLPRFTSVDVVETATGRILLLEHRQGHELLVVENFHHDRTFWVFEVKFASDHVRRWRIPRSAFGSGTLQVGRQLTEQRRGERFEAGLASTRLSCTLVAKASALPHGSTTPVP